jgi:hypothetical protein
VSWRVLKDRSSQSEGHWVHAWGTEFPPQDQEPAHVGARFVRTDLNQEYSWDGAAWNPSGGGPGGGITIREADAVPSVSNADTLIFDQADGFVLTDLGGGDVRVDLSGIPESAVANLVTDLAGKASVQSAQDAALLAYLWN